MTMNTNLSPSTVRRSHHGAPALALRVLLAATTVAATLVPAAATQAAKRTDRREIDARQAFAAGRYQDALNLYAELYADKVHPTYLRNIGRCYQNLKQPEKAVNAFRDYLRQAKAVSAAERSEVESYIAEMEKLQRAQEEAARPPQPVVSAQPDPQPRGPMLPALDPTPASGIDLQADRRTPPPQSVPVYKKGWFWGVVGAVVVAGVAGGLYAGGVFDKSSIPCSAKGGCY